MIDVLRLRTTPAPTTHRAAASALTEPVTPPDVAALVAVLNALGRRGPRDAGTQARLAALAVVTRFPAADHDSAAIDTETHPVDILRHLADDLARSRHLPPETAREVQRRLARTRALPA